MAGGAKAGNDRWQGGLIWNVFFDCAVKKMFAVKKNVLAGHEGRPAHRPAEARLGGKGIPKVFIFDRFYKGLRLGEMPCEFYL